MDRATRTRGWIFGAVIAAWAAACSTEVEQRPASELASPAPVASASPELGVINPRLLRRFQPLPSEMGDAKNPVTVKKVELGRKLFHETRISLAGDLSCSSCHDLNKWGVDGKKTSVGHQGRTGNRNAPTVFNAAGHFAQFWDGRSGSIEDQAKGPILAAGEMAMPSGDEVVARLKATREYDVAFKEAFPDAADPITFDNVAAAIGAFERTLVTPGRWDRFLSGDADALTVVEKEGLKKFLNSGCMVCHTGAYLGGSMFERVGVVEPWPNQADEGRKAVTGVERDRMVFKVPSLRNVAKTGPYFHDGSAATLDDAVRMMGRHQLGIELTNDEVTSIVAWLGSLTGEAPAPDADRPLYIWMKGNAFTALNAKDLAQLARAFRRITAFAPTEYPKWAKIAEEGLRAAEAGDIEGARRTCKSCHDLYRANYRAQFSSRALPAQ